MNRYKWIAWFLAITAVFLCFVGGFPVAKPIPAAADCTTGTATEMGGLGCALQTQTVLCACTPPTGCPTLQLGDLNWVCEAASVDCVKCVRTRGITGYFQPCETNWCVLCVAYCEVTRYSSAWCNNICNLIDECYRTLPIQDICGSVACDIRECPPPSPGVPIEVDPGDPLQ
jgi:hypothetical protein